ncbi:MAG TPA: aminotransferase class V-fold PLP-dependent enzyme [Pirellulales bacterium]|jgi:cysteine desulfurase family protein
MHRIYLDNAATSWPKPDAVAAEVEKYLRHGGAPAGRSAYTEAAEAQQAVTAARAAVARLIGAADAKHIVFTHNGTDALNLAIHGLLKPGDHAICTDADHNSVLRPLRFLEEYRQVEVTRVRCNAFGWVDPDDIRRALRPNTRLVAMLHASNVTGVVEPAAQVGAICRQHGARFLLDAAQSLGHSPVDVNLLNVDLLAAPGHKGLLGPLGTGVLYLRPGMENELQTVRQGGTGTQSDDDRQPETLPDRYECGNHNVPGLVGLAAALAWLETNGEIWRREHELAARLRTGLQKIAGVELHGPANGGDCLGVVSVSIAGYDPQEAAAVLDSTFRVQVRAGLHCAPRIHRAMGTFERGGTVRFSVGAFNTEAEIDAAINAVHEIAN